MKLMAVNGSPRKSWNTAALLQKALETEKFAEVRGYNRYFEDIRTILERIFGPSEILCSYDTCQFEDYSKYVAPRFDPLKKAQW